MKNLIAFKILLQCGMVLVFLSCLSKDNSCPPPIYEDFDWENYNEACKVNGEITSFECSDPRVHQYDGKTIKVCGWLVIENNKITIISDSLHFSDYCGILINCTPEIQMTIGAFDLTRKCFLKGELKLEKFMDGEGVYCCQMGIRRVTLKSMDDIYFEEEEE